MSVTFIVFLYKSIDSDKKSIILTYVCFFLWPQETTQYSTTLTATLHWPALVTASWPLLRRAQCKRESGTPSTDSIPCRAPTLLHENPLQTRKCKSGSLRCSSQVRCRLSRKYNRIVNKAQRRNVLDRQTGKTSELEDLRPYFSAVKHQLWTPRRLRLRFFSSYL